MPLSKIQTDILKLLASHRDPESYIAGSTPLNLEAPRYSGDIDVFRGREERVARAAAENAAVLVIATSTATPRLSKNRWPIINRPIPSTVAC